MKQDKQIKDPQPIAKGYTLGKNYSVGDGYLQYSDLKDSGARQGFDSGAVRDIQVGKGAFDLMPPIAEFFVSRIYEDGAIKYAARNWEKGIPISRFIQSAMRHLAKYRLGLRDEPHLSMAIWNLMGAAHTAALIEIGHLPQNLFDMPDYGLAEKFEALSPYEITSLMNFLGLDEKATPALPTDYTQSEKSGRCCP